MTDNNTPKAPAFLADLNDSQRLAVEYVDGPQLVIAGAGAGKTRVLTYKIAYLLAGGLKPWEIMALTFTNKAAREMKERIDQLVGGKTAHYLRMGTFHSIFSRILRSEAASIGYTNGFTIYDDSDSRSLIKQIIKDMKLDEKGYKPAEVAHRINMAKSRLMTAHDYANDTMAILRDQSDRLPQVYMIYNVYEERCRKSNAMDFDDLLLNTFLLFNRHPEVLRKYCENTHYILVDEYQDTNYAQQRIIGQLTSYHQYVCVVGDDAQSIYGFRGADIDNILDFQKKYPSSKLFKLERNYRSTQRIVEAANSLIRKNKRQIEKNVYSEKDEGDKIALRQLPSDIEEAAYVCNDIMQLMKTGDADSYDDFAILYRTNYQSRTFEEQFMKKGVPYRIYGGLSFYQRKEIKDIIAYMRLVVNHDDDEALRRIINYPARGIGATTMAKVATAAHDASVSMWHVIMEPQTCGLNVNKGTMTRLTDFCTMIDAFTQRIETATAFDILYDIVRQSGITQDIYSGSEPEDLSRQEHLEEFMASVQEFTESAREEETSTRLADFLNDVALLTDRDQKEDDTPKVTLMTIHSSKGLEFPDVYVVGMEENIFPSQMCTDSQRALEEERRLLYVAITRAEQRCTLTCANSRYRYGQIEFDAPSRFIRDIDPRFISTGNDAAKAERPKNVFAYRTSMRPIFQMTSTSASNETAASASSPTPKSKPAYKPRRYNNGPKGDTQFSIGEDVCHDRFGEGVVLDVIDSGDNTKVKVEFKNAGVKMLLVKYARLRKK